MVRAQGQLGWIWAGSTQPRHLPLGITEQRTPRAQDLADLPGALCTNLARATLPEQGQSLRGTRGAQGLPAKGTLPPQVSAMLLLPPRWDHSLLKALSSPLPQPEAGYKATRSE